MAPTATIDDPIVAIYPVPGEIDGGTDKTPALPPMPVRLERAEAEKAVKRGAFSYVDPTFADRKTEADAAADARKATKATTAAASPNAAAVKAAEKAQADAEAAAAAKDAEIEALKAELAAKG
jgi:hypothetical protein